MSTQASASIRRKTIRRSRGARQADRSTGLGYSREIDTEIGAVPIPAGVEGYALGNPGRIGISPARSK